MLAKLILKLKLRQEHWFYLGLVVVTALSFGLRFWHIERFNTFVFDEIYYVKFAQAYLKGMPEFDAHPPLGKYFIAAGIFLSKRASLEGPISYRWMNAFVGGLVPWLVIGISLALSELTALSETRSHPQALAKNTAQNTAKKWTFACLAGGFVAIDGLFITESRYALINIYLVFFGLLGHWLWLQAHLIKRQYQRSPSTAVKIAAYRVMAGIALGCAIATKWNALGYLLSLLVWEFFQTNSLRGSHPIHQPKAQLKAQLKAWLKALGRQFASLGIYGILIPAFTYSALWWPHLHWSKEHFITLHQRLLTFHLNLAASSHPACSRWYSWPLLIKPIAYWYEKNGSWAYTVNNLGNPALWWISSAAIAVLALAAIISITKAVVVSVKNAFSRHSLSDTSRNALFNAPNGGAGNRTLCTYLLISYATNWLPWMMVSRCTFIYLYMPAVIFSFMTLAWLLSEWLYSPVNRPWVKAASWIILGAIALSFLFWLPLSLGLPLTSPSLNWRWWLRSWI